jgi:N-acetylglutamate synthase-like GNAT family acetyltransferase
MVRPATPEDFQRIYEIINDAAQAYKGIIPADRWHEPYMPHSELEEQIADGVRFTCYLEDDEIVGVMGIQDKGEVNLIRHAYVTTERRGGGIGGILLRELVEGSAKPILIGTWQAADWAVRFYEKHGFTQVTEEDKNRLLKTYWTIPERQIETSVVLKDRRFTS